MMELIYAFLLIAATILLFSIGMFLYSILAAFKLLMAIKIICVLWLIGLMAIFVAWWELIDEDK